MRTRYVDIDDRMEDLADRMRGSPELAADFLQKYELSWLYHENALEGVVYTPQELAMALANQPVADATFVSALAGLRHHKAALDLVREEARAKKPKLTVALVKKLYETLCGGPEKTPPDLPVKEEKGTYGEDPRFVDAEKGDLRLLPDSRARAAGAGARPL